MTSDLTIAMGNGGAPSIWYLTSGKIWFKPIDIMSLPGPVQVQVQGIDTVTVNYTGTELDADTLYFGRVATGTLDGTRYFDVVSYYNDVKNIQAIATSAEKLFIDGLVHADVMVGTGSSEGSDVILNGAKRGNVITGAGDDRIEIRMASNSDTSAAWVSDYRVASGAGNDHITLSGLDIQAEIAAGDITFVRQIVSQVPITSTGQGRVTWLDGGAGDDVITGWDSRDNIIGGTDNGTIQTVGGTYEPSGYAYSVGGAKGKSGSYLYKIDLASGQSTIVGEVALSLNKWLKVGGLDMDSLALNPKDGQLYGFATKLGLLDGLVKIDPQTGATSFISLNLSGLRSETQDMTFDKLGNLYFVSNGDFMRVNTATGGITTIGNNTLDKKIGALAFDPTSDRIYGLAETGSKTLVYEIDKTNGKVIGTSTIDGLAKNSKLEGMSFDKDGNLFAIDRVSGKVALIDLHTDKAVYVSQSLGVAQQTGDGFEALAMAAPVFKPLTGLHAVGGDVLTGGLEADHFWYKAGDGVDTITDFQTGIDQLHLTGFSLEQLKIDVFDGNTYIRFIDGSADGFVDDAMIVLRGVNAIGTGDLVLV